MCSSLVQRDRQPELMDDPGLDGACHHAALHELARLNVVSAATSVVWKPIAALARERQLGHLRVLDIATGSGDIPLSLYKRAQRAGLRLEILGLDVSQRAVDLARRRAANEQANVDFEILDVLTGELPAGFDVVMSSLFLHHLENSHAIHLLRQMRSGARQLGLVNDLVRSKANLLLVKLATWLFTRSDIVRTDGPLSVKAAFVPQELLQMATTAGIENAVVSRHWPCRMLLRWYTK